MSKDNGSGFKFWLWNADKEKFRYGLVNLAAFLANAMADGIRDDTCDELNWQQVAGGVSCIQFCGYISIASYLIFICFSINTTRETCNKVREVKRSLLLQGVSLQKQMQLILYSNSNACGQEGRSYQVSDAAGSFSKRNVANHALPMHRMKRGE